MPPKRPWGLSAVDCQAHRVSSPGGGGSGQRPGLLGYRPQRCLIPALPDLDPTCTDQSAQSTVKIFCGTEPPLQFFPCSPRLPSIHHVSWPAARPPTPASPRLSPRLSLHLTPHRCLALSGCPISVAPACSLSITQSQWQMAPPPSAGPSPPPRLLDITHPHLQPFPPRTLGPRDPCCEKISFLITQAPTFSPQSTGYILSQGMLGSLRQFAWRLRKGGRGPGNGSTPGPCLHTGLHSLKRHPSPVCGYGLQL